MNAQIIFAVIALSCAAECRVDDGGRGRGRVPDIEGNEKYRIFIHFW